MVTSLCPESGGTSLVSEESGTSRPGLGAPLAGPHSGAWAMPLWVSLLELKESLSFGFRTRKITHHVS